ncbi:glycosyltransferase [Candidatus Woesearchaeota archaeon]|nr:glycosyltransferase [Candidatus Woesearchaeota archaeon]
MKNKLLVSVIIPAYNSARFICEAIDSVLAQSYKNFEIVVVDDGSTDDTKKVLKKYKNKIRYIYQENKKQAAARNKGIENSKGELIAFLDADDTWMKDKLKLQVPLFEEDVGLVYGGICLFDGKKVKPGIHTNEFVKGRVFKELLMANFICASSVIIRKECIDKVGMFKEGISYFGVEDYHMWLKVCHTYKADYIKEPILMYRVHSGSTSEDYCSIIRREATVRKDIANLFNLPKKLRNNSLFNSYFRLAYYSIENKKYKDALKALIQSLNLKPFNYKNYKLLVRILIRG